MYEHINPFRHLDPLRPSDHVWVWLALIGCLFAYLVR